MGAVRLLLAVLLLTGCASGRYLTEEQDANMRANCHPAGCKVVPAPMWRQIEQFFERLGAPPMGEG